MAAPSVRCGRLNVPPEGTRGTLGVTAWAQPPGNCKRDRAATKHSPPPLEGLGRESDQGWGEGSRSKVLRFDLHGARLPIGHLGRGSFAGCWPRTFSLSFDRLPTRPAQNARCPASNIQRGVALPPRQMLRVHVAVLPPHLHVGIGKRRTQRRVAALWRPRTPAALWQGARQPPCSADRLPLVLPPLEASRSHVRRPAIHACSALFRHPHIRPRCTRTFAALPALNPPNQPCFDSDQTTANHIVAICQRSAPSGGRRGMTR